MIQICEPTRYLYETLKTLVIDGDVSDSHVLKRVPVDPFSHGQTTGEYRAVKELASLCGLWAVRLRQLYYGYCQSCMRVANLHTGITYMTMYDSEMRELLRSHPGDSQLFPTVFFPDMEKEAAFRAKIRQSDEMTNPLCATETRESETR